MSYDPDPVIRLFNEALRLDPAVRREFLEVSCGSDPNLFQVIESLLAAHERAGDFLDKPVSFVSPADPPEGSGERPGDRVGQYKLLQQIGEGGCGIVYMAEQEKPFRRKVALKIVKPGMDTKSVVARFQAERQALAVMDHPNIAKVFDAGVTDSGRPYFVMELIRGVRITEFCDKHSLAIPERLKLAIHVCHAVQHAHQKGIVHRDLKPSNILVTRGPDGGAIPMVIDFGIAKAIAGHRLADSTLFTAFEMLVGTPAYMSPEQAAFTGLDVDTRTDVYALGVLLYELLTGTTPFDAGELLKAGLDGIRREILERDPVLPSVRLRTMEPADLAATAGHRRIEPARLIRLVRGDLDWIVAKAMEKERSRRYPTASALAADLQRHLSNETIAARPPSTSYKLGKWIARNRILAAALALLALLLSTGLAATTALLAREREARRQADQERNRAETVSQTNQQVVKFLRETLVGVSPTIANGRDTTLLRAIFARADQRIAEELAGQPEAEAEIRITLGSVSVELGDNGAAERAFRRVLELQAATPLPETAGIASARNMLAIVLLRQGRISEAEAECSASLGIWRRIAHGGDSRSVDALSLMAIIKWRQNELGEAEKLMRQVIALRSEFLPPGHPSILSVEDNLGWLLSSGGRLDDAADYVLEVLGEREKRFGGENQSVAVSLDILGTIRGRQGDNAAAGECLERVAAIRERILPEGHPNRVAARITLASHLARTGNPAAAAESYRLGLWEARRRGDELSKAELEALKRFMALLIQRGKHEEFERFLREFLPQGISEGCSYLPVWRVRAEFLARSGRWDETVAIGFALLDCQPAEHENVHILAPALVASNDMARYRELCREIPDRFGGTTDAFVADRMAKDCLIAPVSGLNLTVVASMADTAVTRGSTKASYPMFQLCKALAEYRLGNHASAIKWAENIKETFPHAYIEAGAVIAMARHRLGDAVPAASQLADLRERFNRLPSLETGDLGGDWRDWIFARALLEEAGELIGGSPR